MAIILITGIIFSWISQCLSTESCNPTLETCECPKFDEIKNQAIKCNGVKDCSNNEDESKCHERRAFPDRSGNYHIKCSMESNPTRRIFYVKNRNITLIDKYGVYEFNDTVINFESYSLNVKLPSLHFDDDIKIVCHWLINETFTLTKTNTFKYIEIDDQTILYSYNRQNMKSELYCDEMDVWYSTHLTGHILPYKFRIMDDRLMERKTVCRNYEGKDYYQLDVVSKRNTQNIFNMTYLIKPTFCSFDKLIIEINGVKCTIDNKDECKELVDWKSSSNKIRFLKEDLFFMKCEYDFYTLVKEKMVCSHNKYGCIRYKTCIDPKDVSNLRDNCWDNYKSIITKNDSKSIKVEEKDVITTSVPNEYWRESDNLTMIDNVRFEQNKNQQFEPELLLDFDSESERVRKVLEDNEEKFDYELIENFSSDTKKKERMKLIIIFISIFTVLIAILFAAIIYRFMGRKDKSFHKLNRYESTLAISSLKN